MPAVSFFMFLPLSSSPSIHNCLPVPIWRFSLCRRSCILSQYWEVMMRHKPRADFLDAGGGGLGRAKPSPTRG
eukprot:4326478-Prymnesium_polylepis.1